LKCEGANYFVSPQLIFDLVNILLVKVGFYEL